DRDDRFVHIPVNREESAIGLCSGAYMGAMGCAALMGASGFMTVIYANRGRACRVRREARCVASRQLVDGRDRRRRPGRPIRAHPGQSGGIRDRALLRRLYGRHGVRGADGRVGLHDGDLRHHQDQLHLRDPAVFDADFARRRWRSSQAPRVEQPLSSPGARGHQHALSNHRRARRYLRDLPLLSPHAHVLPSDGRRFHARPVTGWPVMNYLDCFRALARRRTDQLVVTSAGNSSPALRGATHDCEASFYRDASMSLSTMFASGLALARPELKIWAFMGDGAFCMNPGMLMVERQMNLPNLTHFLVSNRVYGATSNAVLPNVGSNDYPAIAHAMGLERVFEFRTLEALERDFATVMPANVAGHTFVVLEVEPFSDAEQKLEQPPFDGPELKYRFGRHIEARTDCDVFGYRL